MVTYSPKTFDLSGLQGISDQTLEMHFKLYAGYVTNTNLLNEQLSEMLKAGITPDKMPVYSELKRRLGFEYNGMVLHEYYFGNMKKGGSSDPASGAFHDAAAKSFGSFALWKADFVAVGKMRGVGWAICFRDPATGNLSNHWVSDHEYGNVAGYIPTFVMDVWEHAFLLDYKPADRPKYIDAFLANADWSVADSRVK